VRERNLGLDHRGTERVGHLKADRVGDEDAQQTFPVIVAPA